MADETPKIEPTLIVTDAPSIAAGDQASSAEAAKPETAESAPKIAEAPKAEAKIEPEKTEPKIEAPTLPPAAQLGEPATAIIPFKRPEPKTEQVAAPQARTARFALLAACVAIAASFGAIGGSLGVAKFAPMISPAPAPVAVAPVQKENVAEEMKALKETVVQLRTATRTLSENLAALKTSVNTSNTAQNTQIGKIAETLERVEKGQTEQRKTIAAAAASTAHAQDITGSIAKPQTTDPNNALKNSIVQGWVLRRVYDGAALIESRDGIIEVEPGSIAPGLGRIEGIKRQDGRWVVMTSRGLVIGR